MILLMSEDCRTPSGFSYLTHALMHTHTQGSPVSEVDEGVEGGGELGGSSFSLDSGTGLMMNLRPAEWTTCDVALARMSGGRGEGGREGGRERVHTFTSSRRFYSKQIAKRLKQSMHTIGSKDISPGSSSL